MDEGFNTFSTARAVRAGLRSELPSRCATSRLRAVGVQGHPARARDGRQPARRLSPRRQERRAVDADLPVFPVERRQHHLQQDGVVAEHARAGGSAGRWCSARWRCSSASGAFKHPKPADFFTIANRVTGRDLTPYFDQVYRGSNVFDYGVQDLRSARDGDQYRTSVVVRRFGEATFPVELAGDVQER